MHSSLIRLFIILFFPFLLNGNGEYYNHEPMENHIHVNGGEHNANEGEGELGDNDDDDDDHDLDDIYEIGHNMFMWVIDQRDWFDTEIDDGVKWSLAFDSTDFEDTSEIQHLIGYTTRRFGKALVIDGLLQTAELDEYAYHENLVHPALLIHNEPKTVFIMGGGGGSAAREVFKHEDIEKVIICEIDRKVVNLCREHMAINHEAFNDERLQIVFNNAKDELTTSEEKFDVIIGDVCDPNELSHSNNLCTKSFYEHVVKPKLNDNGIFVTQAGPAGLLSHKAVFSVVYNTIKQVFTHVVGYTVHVPSYGDLCGLIMASNEPIHVDVEQLNIRIGERVRGELKYLDGPVIAASTVLNKTLKNSLMEETRVLTEENVRFVRGRVRHRV